MKALKEIKRRARDVMRALRGEGVHELPPTRITIDHTHRDIVTFGYTHKVDPAVYKFDALRLLEFTQEKLAEHIGRDLLEKGFIEVETTEDYLSGEPGPLISMKLEVVRPEGQKEGEA